jgi:hypothetical protein
VRHREQVSVAQLVGRWAIVKLRGKFVSLRAKKGTLAKVELCSFTNF